MIIKMLLVPTFMILMGSSVCAKTLLFVDQNNNPLSDVVISAPDLVSTSAQPQTPAEMDQVDKQFSPQVLVIEKGRQVAFPNSDNIRHHVYSFSEAKPFEIKLYSGDSAAPVSFNTSGIVVLGCNIHDNMIGYIYVHDSVKTWLTDATGRINIPDEVTELDVWHPHLFVVKNRNQHVSVTDNEDVQTVQLQLDAVPAPAKQTNTFQKRPFGG